MIDLSHYTEEKPKRLKRFVWVIVNSTIFRILVGPPLRHCRTFVLRLFGAKMPYCSSVYHSCNIFAPWNLVIGEYTCVGPNTTLYNKANIIIGNNCTISQGAFLCTAGHDISDKQNKLIIKPIIIHDGVWVAADAYVNMGVVLGEGSVVGARSAVFKDVEPWTVVGGNPSKYLKQRIIKE